MTYPLPASIESKLKLLASLSEIHASAPEAAKPSILVNYLFEVAELIAEQSGSEATVRPLVGVIETLAADEQAAAAQTERRRGGSNPPPELLGRIAATLEIMLEARITPENAAQTLARQMMRAGVDMPAQTGDVRAWKRLLLWHELLRHSEKPAEAWQAYREFKASLVTQHGPRAGVLALSEALWDYRRAPKS